MKELALILIAASTVAFASEGGAGGNSDSGDLVMMEPITINLSEEHYIQFVSQVRLNDPAGKERMTAHMPGIRFELIKAMLGQEFASASTPAFMESFAEKAVKIINTTMGGEHAKAVLLDRWIVQ